MTEKILVIDEGTTSTRAMLFAADGQELGSAQHALTQNYPEPGRVEHDASEIWEYSLAAARAMVEKAGGGANIASIGITNQRETIIFWNRQTGEPLCPAIVWQDRRTASICDNLKTEGHEAVVQQRTGLLLDPYFSGSKIGWALEHWPQLREAGDNLAVGTVESYLVFRLTGGLHITDASNAARTALMDIDNGRWDAELCALFGVPMGILPEITDCSGRFAETAEGIFDAPIAICGMAGDQQAATIGQACFEEGDTKATYGTGAFVLSYTGVKRRHSAHRILSTIGWQIDGERHYALEGSVFVAGSLMQWLRDQLGMIVSAGESEALAQSVADNAGVYIVPALSGLGAPYWQADARAAISGLSFSATKAHIVRAALEAMSYQTADLKSAFAADGADWKRLRIDGGMVANSWMSQDLADILAIEVDRPQFVETTALGAAMLAALGAGLYPDLGSAAQMRTGGQVFTPAMDDASRNARMAGWRSAVASVLTSKQGAG
ncbi:glycerol kinase GlpK [Parasphingorhabdus sp. DH2-15]|uniref:glycerol kinase GlpK n=1 Tax=Parasphingorhabdus sp. DH2-15 TaxID=3444112 RepID=UPI003F6830EB